MSSHDRSSGTAAKTGAGPGRPAPGRLRCDFCGEETTSVRRVALDRAYERLRTPHVERYACAACSEKKERSRLGLDRPARG